MSVAEIATDETGMNPARERHKRPKRSRRGWLIAVVVVLIVVAAGAVYFIAGPFPRTSGAATINNGTATSVAQVTKGDLSERTMQNGTLGYAGDYKLVNNASGTLTKLPAVGDIIKQGRVLYSVAGSPVVLLQGRYVPAYRSLSWGSEGADVKQLNAALVALGYASKSRLDPTSDVFGRATYNALRKLQGAVGLEKTGELPLGQAVFVPAEKIRVTKVKGIVGASIGAGQTIIEASSTNRQITVELNASQQSSVAAGDKVVITLPTGRTTPGKVTSVGKVATKGDSSTTIDVLIKPLKPAETGQLDQAPVQVSIVSETAKNVLSVPVNALLSLAGGGYAVEVVDAGGAHRLIAVKTGLFDDSAGRVEVSGTGLSAGQNVVVPAS